MGGKALSAGACPDEVAGELKKLAGHQVCLVHGGGSEINEQLSRLGITPRFVNGLRVTDGPTMEVVEMVLSGKVNPGLVGQLNHCGVRAVGLCGKDGGLVSARQAHPNTGLGLVGEPEDIDPGIIVALWERGFIPVISSIGAGHGGGSLNLNADTMACALAKALQADALVLFTDSEGVYGEAHGEKRLIPKIKRDEVNALIEQRIITDGMIPKIREAAYAKAGGVGNVWITGWNSSGLEPLIREGGFHGTEIL